MLLTPPLPGPSPLQVGHMLSRTTASARLSLSSSLSLHTFPTIFDFSKDIFDNQTSYRLIVTTISGRILTTVYILRFRTLYCEDREGKECSGCDWLVDSLNLRGNPGDNASSCSGVESRGISQDVGGQVRALPIHLLRTPLAVIQNHRYRPDLTNYYHLTQRTRKRIYERCLL